MPRLPVGGVGLCALVAIAASPVQAPSIELVSVADDGTPGNDWSSECAGSDDGTRIAFSSRGTNLVAGDTNGFQDIFVRDRAAGTTIRVSVATDGTQANGDCYGPRISGDGAFVVFHSFATTLVPG